MAKIHLYGTGDLLRPSDFRRSTRSREKSKRQAYSIDTAGEYGRLIHSPSFRRLQGKMQLFPPTESPLLRNRLTHSLEVGDIAARIATLLNVKYKSAGVKIDTAIAATAALAHDIGHPPFGHSGEKALHQYMDGHGGFEGNAQTLRVITRLENRLSLNFPSSNVDPSSIYSDPLGLNLLLRTIASVVKYDVKIPSNYSGQLMKGYYDDDSQIVDLVRENIIGSESTRNLKTIECQIMDLADDIAYATYDLEDCMVSGVSSPLDLMSASDHIHETIARDLNKRFGSQYSYEFNNRDIALIFFDLFDHMIKFSKKSNYFIENTIDKATYVILTARGSKELAERALLRRKFSERLIRNAIDAITISKIDEATPSLSQIDIDEQYLLKIEALKRYNYHAVIMSSNIQLHQAKAFKVIGDLARSLENDVSLLPPSLKQRFEAYVYGDGRQFDYKTGAIEVIKDYGKGQVSRLKRFICDYIASLTDAEAISLYGKINAFDEKSMLNL